MAKGVHSPHPGAFATQLMLTLCRVCQVLKARLLLQACADDSGTFFISSFAPTRTKSTAYSD